MSRECNRVVVCTDGAGAARLGSRLIVLRQPRTFPGQLQPIYDLYTTPRRPHRRQMLWPIPAVRSRAHDSESYTRDECSRGTRHYQIIALMTL